MTAQTVEYMCHSGSDLLVVNAARTSFSKESKEFNDKDAKLIHFLAREKHLLPFRHPSLTLRCKAPMFVARQLSKHQTGMSWSEESRRYIKTPVEMFNPELRKVAPDVKQGSQEELAKYEGLYIPGATTFTPEAMADWMLTMHEEMLASGAAPEVARAYLPQGACINWVWTGTLLAWSHMIRERSSSRTQKETREFARLVEAVVREHFPVSMEALMNV